MNWFASKRTGYALLAFNVVVAVAYYDSRQWLSTAAAFAAGSVLAKLWHWEEIEE